MFAKRDSAEKIDPIVAATMAYRRAMVAPTRSIGSLGGNMISEIDLETLSDAESSALVALNQTSNLSDPQQWLIDALGGGSSSSGVRVSSATAIGLPAVFASVQLIAGHIGAMPLRLFRESSDGTRTEIRNHPSIRLLQVAPNQLQTPMTFKESLMVHALMDWQRAGNDHPQFVGTADRVATDASILDLVHD